MEAADGALLTAWVRRNGVCSQERGRVAWEGVERLYQLTRELREEVEKTTTTDVFSVRMYKKAEQIEKVAKRLKGKAQGG